MEEFQNYLENDNEDQDMLVEEEQVVENYESDLESLFRSKSLAKKDMDSYKPTQSANIFNSLSEALKSGHEELKRNVDDMVINEMSLKEEGGTNKAKDVNLISIKDFIKLIRSLSNDNLNTLTNYRKQTSASLSSNDEKIKDLKWIALLIDDYNLNTTPTTSIQVIEKLKTITDSLDDINSTLDSFIINELKTNGVNAKKAEIYHKNVTPYDSSSILLNLEVPSTTRSRRLVQRQ